MHAFILEGFNLSRNTDKCEMFDDSDRLRKLSAKFIRILIKRKEQGYCYIFTSIQRDGREARQGDDGALRS